VLAARHTLRRSRIKTRALVFLETVIEERRSRERTRKHPAKPGLDPKGRGYAARKISPNLDEIVGSDPGGDNIGL